MVTVPTAPTVPTAQPSPAPQTRRRRSPLFRGVPLAISGLSALSPALAAWLFAYFFTRPRRQKLPGHERDWLLQATAQPMRLTSGEEVPLYEWRSAPCLSGVRDEAPLATILLVHGFGGRAGQMGGFAAPLVAAGYRVVAVDAPAHGAAAGARSSLPEMLQVTREVAARFGCLAGVVAHSNGAAATVAALTQGMRAEKVALLAPMSDLERYMQRLASQLGVSKRVAQRAQQRIEARYGLPFSALKASDLARQLTQPALILQDSADRTVPLAEVEELAQSWPGARLQLSTGLGHTRLLRDRAVIASVVAHFGAPSQH
ncbi:alpha/beta hydrolase [Pseudophaeobacter leonis]|uniref:alpha/beta hydrolase n=1 Tax=Pseudophaeobacter leonis TaxID=1144477 RepID=UPI0009F25710|nr:alpha/beta fold hydrolase [Pseudophaeobacter leonis]